jgi:hypothetical protein
MTDERHLRPASAPSRYVAICPECDRRADYLLMPRASIDWPQCDQCSQSMNIYERCGNSQ